MTAEDISLRVVRILNEHAAPYMLVGALSTNFYSAARSTKDADIVVQANLGETARLIERHFPSLRADPQLGFEGVTATPQIILRSTADQFVVELFGLSDDPHDQQRFARRHCIDWEGTPTWVATAEDALITKLRWAQSVGREKDIADARSVMAVQGDALDWPYIEPWCDRHGSRPLLERLRAELRAR